MACHEEDGHIFIKRRKWTQSPAWYCVRDGRLSEDSLVRMRRILKKTVEKHLNLKGQVELQWMRKKVRRVFQRER